MTNIDRQDLDSKLDLMFERIVDVPKERIWRAWTTPEHLMPWFCPLPWKTIDCEIDLRPGGIFRTVMQSPEGEEFSDPGCYLEVVENSRLVWTNALQPSFRPAPMKVLDAKDVLTFFFTATIALAAQGSGTRYTAIVRHGDEASCRKHAAMGFEEGWGKELEQLIAYAKKM